MNCSTKSKEEKAIIEHLEKSIKSRMCAVVLNEQKTEEIEYHNKVRDYQELESMNNEDLKKLTGNKKYYATAIRYQNYVDEWIKHNTNGRVFLDYACGDGHNARTAAKSDATLVIGMDISDQSIENCKKLASAEGLGENLYFYQGDCEETGLPSDSIDVAVCCGMLHHLNLEIALPELKRIMKDGGKILAFEALDYNPFIKIYRKMTPRMRTKWEVKHILSHREVRLIRKYFKVNDIKYWHLCSILATPFRSSKYFKRILSFFDRVDDIILRIPGLRLMAWMFSFEMIKSEN